MRYCDKQLLESLEKQFNLTSSGIEKLKGEKKNWLSEFLEAVAPVPNSGTYIGFEPLRGNHWNNSQVKVDEIYEAEAQILRGIAEESSCVIAGRSGFFVLKRHPNKLDIFIQAPLEQRVERVMKKQGLSEKEAREVIASVDESRENYVRRCAGVSRYDTRNYDLVLNVGEMSDDDAVACILKYIKFISK